jgi:L-seryl-tRNA(Ser) seleniumtransferase
MQTTNILLKALPKVDDCLADLRQQPELAAPAGVLKRVVQEVIAQEREKILRQDPACRLCSVEEWRARFHLALQVKMRPNFRRVINGTGVVIHTNLGRSVLSPETTNSLALAGGYYSNLEFNLDSGKRGSRYSLVEDILCELTGAEAALVVNNNAAAVFLSLATLAEGREVIVSRGQLVEIGGSFRIPDIMARSGARLVEVGATNRTHLYDYERAITAETALLLRVHTSNFRMIGFTSAVAPEELVALARDRGLTTMEDLGSGCLVDLSPYGFPKEPTVQEVVGAGIDVVTFSGDKLLGGPQAGIIVGRAEAVARIKKNPLNRALRIDKFTLAGLESVLRQYYDPDLALATVPTLAMLTVPPAVLKKRALRLARQLRRRVAEGCRFTVVPTQSRVGGGALPEHGIASWAVVLAPQQRKLTALERGLRQLAVPIIGRIENEAFLLDVRTIQEREVPLLVELLADFFVPGARLE